MHFVDDVHFIAHRHGRILHLFAQVAHLVDAVVGRRVDLRYVEVGRIGERFARLALAAGRAVYRVQAVDRLGKNFRRARFARAARPAKEVGVPHPARFDLVGEYPYDVFLPHEFPQRCRAEGAVQCLITHWFSLNFFRLYGRRILRGCAPKSAEFC